MFGISIFGEIVPLLRSEPDRVFLGYVDPASTMERKIRAINEKREPITIVGLHFPTDIKGTYDVVDVEPWKKDVLIRVNVPIIRENVGKFLIVMTVRQAHGQVDTIRSPCLYIGRPTARSVRHAERTRCD